MAPTLVARNTFEDSGTMILQHVRMLRAHVACACCMRVRMLHARAHACVRSCVHFAHVRACMHARAHGREIAACACVRECARPPARGEQRATCKLLLVATAEG
jgi:hypothetical protein